MRAPLTDARRDLICAARPPLTTCTSLPLYLVLVPLLMLLLVLLLLTLTLTLCVRRPLVEEVEVRPRPRKRRDTVMGLLSGTVVVRAMRARGFYVSRWRRA